MSTAESEQERVRVIVWCRDRPQDPDGIERAFHQISTRLRGTEGLLRSELLRSQSDPQSAAVLSEWQSMTAFQAWEEGADHRRDTAPLRPFQDRTRPSTFEFYRVTAFY